MSRRKIYLLCNANYLNEAKFLYSLCRDKLKIVCWRSDYWDLPYNDPMVYVRWGCLVPFPYKDDRPVVNKLSAINKAINKPVARLLLKEANIPTPETWLHLDQVKFPCIVRQEYHAFGLNFFIANSEADMAKVPFEPPYYFQEIYPNEVEYRAHVAGGQIHCQLKKHERPGELRRNASITGEPQEVITDMPDHVQEIALRAMDALRLDFGAVDIMTSENHQHKAVICEINVMPGMAQDKRKAQGYIDYFLKMAV